MPRERTSKRPESELSRVWRRLSTARGRCRAIMGRMTWNPQQYLKFFAERARPAADLLRKCGPRMPG